MHRPFALPAPVAALLSVLALTLSCLVLDSCRPAPSWVVTADLVELFPRAETSSETRLLDFGSAELDRHLGSGWSRAPEGEGNSFRWSLGDHSEVRLNVARLRDLVVTLRCWPLGFPGAPSQIVTVRLNGSEVARLELEERPREYPLTLPEDALRLGSNELRFEYRYHRAPSQVLPASGDDRPLAVAWDWLRITNARDYGTPRVAGPQQGSGLIVPFYSTVDYYLGPGHEVFAVERLIPWGEWHDDTEAQLRVGIETTPGRTLVETLRVPPGGGGPFEVEIPASGEGPVHLSLSVLPTADPPAGERGLMLQAPRLRSRPAPLPETPRGPRSADFPRHDPTARQPNVVIYLVDTLRADHLGCYGYPRPTSPNIDAFARDATRFGRAEAQSPWTRTAVASLFTGLNARSHGTVGDRSTLAPSLPVLAEILGQRGYDTLAAVTNGNVSATFGFERGFDTYRQLAEDLSREVHRQSDQVNQVVYPWLEGQPSDRPFFLYVHTTDPHGPYSPRQPYRDRFAAHVTDPHTGTLQHLTSTDPETAPRAAQRNDLMALYDAEVAFNDANFGDFLDKLKELDLYSSSLILFLSDHGEAFYEHGKWQHGQTLYAEELRVPFLLKLPGGLGRGRTVWEVARQIDVLPTLLDYLNAPIPPQIEGRSLLPLILGRRPRRDPVPTFGYHVGKDHYLESVSVGHHKLIRAYFPATQRWEIQLYDVSTDPTETRNLALQEPLWREYLQSLFKVGPQATVSPPQTRIDSDLREALRALGYL